MEIRKGTPEDVAAVASLYDEWNSYLEENCMQTREEILQYGMTFPGLYRYSVSR